VEEGLAMLNEIEGLDGYHLLHAARADLYRRLDLRSEAAVQYRLALELTANESETRYLERRLTEVS
jgi:RNA polymerase sigma-70 factor (ECF subfamily)